MQFVRREVAKMTKHCIVVEMHTRLLKIHKMSSVVGGDKLIQLKEEKTPNSPNMMEKCVDHSFSQLVRPIIILYSSHTHTVVRECFKVDETSEWKRPKFDPSPHQNPAIFIKIGRRDYVLDGTRHAKLGSDQFRDLCSLKIRDLAVVSCHYIHYQSKNKTSYSCR